MPAPGRLLLPIAAILFLFLPAILRAGSPPVHLAANGRAAMPVVISRDASTEVRELAGTLAEYLGRISGAQFEVVVGDGRTGLALGKADAFAKLGLQSELDGAGFGADEQYLLRSHAEGLYAVGRSDLAVQHAVWDLLYRLGHRQFFPGPVWEFVPEESDLVIAVDAHEKPDYAYRQIWYAWGMWDTSVEPYRQWRIRNRTASAFELETGHAYKYIVQRFRAEFDAHPEYMALVGGKRVLPMASEAKFCVSNPGLRKLVVRYAEDYFKERPTGQCISIDPSDGDGWCECERCVAMGSPSDRALALANDISVMLEEKYPDKYVGMYAYNQHSAPPTIPVRPRVIINAATAFIKGGLTVEQVIRGWKQQGVRQFGIREYYAVNEWHRDLPGAPRGTRLEYLAKTIPRFHDLGARFVSAESSDNWAPCGPGYYVASRLLWDVEEAKRVDALVDDFLQKCFGAASPAMAQFYELLGSPTVSLMSRRSPLPSRELIGRMYRLLAEATRATEDRAVRRRIDCLVLYARYVELFRAYDVARNEARQAAFEQLIRHAYRMRETMMVHSRALYEDLVARDTGVKIPREAAWEAPEGKNPWKSSQPWSRVELAEMVRDGIEQNPIAGFPPVAYSKQLVPASPLPAEGLPEIPDSDEGRETQVYYTWFDSAPRALTLKVTGGLMAEYRDRGNVRLGLYAISGENTKLVDHSEEVRPDGRPRQITLHSNQMGLHKLVVEDGDDKTEVVWPKGVARTIALGQEAPSVPSGQRSGYFYVPSGTRVLGGYGHPDEAGEIRNAGFRVVFQFRALQGPDYFQVPVEPGQDGRFWSFRQAPGDFRLLTVPPYVAKHPGELLLPIEIVRADASAK